MHLPDMKGKGSYARGGRGLKRRGRGTREDGGT